MLPIVRVVLVVVVFAGICSCSNSDNASHPAATMDQEGIPGSSRLAGLLGTNANSDFPLALDPVEFSFPRDHGPHPEFRNEWWYLTGNLDAVSGERFGFELTIFRFALMAEMPEADSAWRTNQIYIAHFAVTDADKQRFYVAQRYSRGAVGLAGAQADPLRVWLEDWSLEATGTGLHGMPWQLQAAADDVALDVRLQALKPVTLNGNAGLSQKSAEPGNASYYYSMTRLASQGSIRIADERYSVSGLAWLDREWSSSALAGDQKGWDWFALQFDDGSELMFYQLRRLDGSVDRFSAGTFVSADGSRTSLAADDVDLEVLDYWRNDAGDEYPITWKMKVAPIGLDVEISPVFRAQELNTTVRYWEGAVDLDGERDGSSVSGRGYVEMTGYSD